MPDVSNGRRQELTRRRSIAPLRLASVIRHRLLKLLSPLLLVGAVACTPPGPDPSAPNVVLVVVDTLRADHLGTYGFPSDTSPALDALAAEAAIFERAIAASSHTAPSHASVMTSRPVRAHSIGYQNGTTRLEGGTTLAEYFEAAGYDTAAFIGNAVIRRQTGLDRGFALYDDELPEAERNRPNYFERTALRTTERAVAWLERERSQPYFLWVHYQDPHGPYTPPAPWQVGLEVPEVASEVPLRLLPHQSGKRGLPAYQYLGGPRDPRRYRELYAGEIRHFHTGLERLRAVVEATSPARETLWLITADQAKASTRTTSGSPTDASRLPTSPASRSSCAAPASSPAATTTSCTTSMFSPPCSHWQA